MAGAIAASRGVSPRWYGLLPVPMRHDAASADAHQRNQEETEMDATTVAVDVAKTVFEVAIANRQWHIVARHRFNRRQFTRFLATDGSSVATFRA